jgi:tRNA (guanine10-N2)-methyltransferase
MISGSRRLITYRRLLDAEVPENVLRERKYQANGVSADELNPFRRRYFQGFRSS